jgi:hypothetical protein
MILKILCHMIVMVWMIACDQPTEDKRIDALRHMQTPTQAMQTQATQATQTDRLSELPSDPNSNVRVPLLDENQEAVEFKPLPEMQAAQEVDTEVQEAIPVSIEPTPWNPLAFSRIRKRMDVDQLSRAFAQFNGNLGWHTNGGQDRWRAQWASLGGPNFLTRVNEDLRPSVLFTKVIRDAAIEVCIPLVDLEVSSNPPTLAQRHLVYLEDSLQMPSDQAHFRSALSWLLKRAHGILLPNNDPEIDLWLNLLIEVSQRDTVAEGWRAVCVATLIHPRFWSY